MFSTHCCELLGALRAEWSVPVIIFEIGFQISNRRTVHWWHSQTCATFNLHSIETRTFEGFDSDRTTWWGAPNGLQDGVLNWCFLKVVLARDCFTSITGFDVLPQSVTTRSADAPPCGTVAPHTRVLRVMLLTWRVGFLGSTQRNCLPSYMQVISTTHVVLRRCSSIHISLFQSASSYAPTDLTTSWELGSIARAARNAADKVQTLRNFRTSSPIAYPTKLITYVEGKLDRHRGPHQLNFFRIMVPTRVSFQDPTSRTMTKPCAIKCFDVVSIATPPEFLLTLPFSGIVHHPSCPDTYARQSTVKITGGCRCTFPSIHFHCACSKHNQKHGHTQHTQHTKHNITHNIRRQRETEKEKRDRKRRITSQACFTISRVLTRSQDHSIYIHIDMSVSFFCSFITKKRSLEVYCSKDLPQWLIVPFLMKVQTWQTTRGKTVNLKKKNFNPGQKLQPFNCFKKFDRRQKL